MVAMRGAPSGAPGFLCLDRSTNPRVAAALRLAAKVTALSFPQDKSQRKKMLILRQVIMLSELTVNRVLDNQRLPNSSQ